MRKSPDRTFPIVHARSGDRGVPRNDAGALLRVGTDPGGVTDQGDVPFDRPPPVACWRHHGLRSGFEVAFLTPGPGGLRVEGTTAGLEDGDAWVVAYELRLDASWSTRRARIRSKTALSIEETVLESDGAGHWTVDGREEPVVDGCLDIDLECSALTNALPVHRLALAVGERREAPAAYVPVSGGPVARLDQSYLRVPDAPRGQRYDYRAPAFDFSCRLRYDASGFVVDYPGLATRAR